MVGMAFAQPAVAVLDLAIELIHQLQARVDVRSPGLRNLELGKDPPALGAEEVGDRAGPAEGHERRVDPVLQRRSVLDQVHPKAGRLALLADPRIGQPDLGDQGELAQPGENARVDLVGFAGDRSERLDLLGVGDQDVPAEASSVSWT